MKTLKIIDIFCYISTRSFDKLPEEIKYKGRIFRLNSDRDYISTTSGLSLAKYLDGGALETELNSEAEILEKNDEFEDIEEFVERLCLDRDEITSIERATRKQVNENRDMIMQLIKNQKKIIERLNNENSE